jgi:uncharacterized protein YukE
MDWSSGGAAITALSVGLSMLGAKLVEFAGGIGGWFQGAYSAVAGFIESISLGAIAVSAILIGLAAGIGASIGWILSKIPGVERGADWVANWVYGDPKGEMERGKADEAEWRKGDTYKAFQKMQPGWAKNVAIANRRLTLGRATSQFQEEHANESEYNEAHGKQLSISEYVQQWKQASVFVGKLNREINSLRESQKGLNQNSDRYKEIQEEIDAFDKERKGMYGIQKTAVSEVTSQIEKQADAEERLSEAKARLSEIKESKEEAVAHVTENTADRIADLKEHKPVYGKAGADQLGDSLSKMLITSWEKRREIEHAEKREAKELERIANPNSPQNRAILHAEEQVRHAQEHLDKLSESFTRKIVELFQNPCLDLKLSAQALQNAYRQMHPLSNGM